MPNTVYPSVTCNSN